MTNDILYSILLLIDGKLSMAGGFLCPKFLDQYSETIAGFIMFYLENAGGKGENDLWDTIFI